MEVPGGAGGSGEAALYETGPDRRGYIFRYLAALTPLVLYAVSLFTAGMMEAYFGGFSPAVRGQIGALMPGTGDMIQLTILLTAPVGIYLTFVVIGWMVRSTEMWAGAALALGLAAFWGFIRSTLYPDTALGPTLSLLTEMSFLIGIASLTAVMLVLVLTELSRRSTRYRVMDWGLVLRGGIGTGKENRLAWHEISEIFMEQNPLEKLLNTGTVIPVRSENPARRDGRKGAGKGGRDPSRSPLDCLSSVRDPELVLALLLKLSSEAGAA